MAHMAFGTSGCGRVSREVKRFGSRLAMYTHHNQHGVAASLPVRVGVTIRRSSSARVTPASTPPPPAPLSQPGSPPPPPPPPPPITLASSRSHCEELVRRSDASGYLATLSLRALQPHTRHAAIALRAVNIELGRVRDAARSPQAASLRFAWWRDVVGASFHFGQHYRTTRLRTPQGGRLSVVDDSPSQFEHAAFEYTVERGQTDDSAHPGVVPHPVALALACAAADHNLTQAWMSRLVRARAREADSFANVSDMERYAEDTTSSLLYLLLESSDRPVDSNLEHIASHVGKGVGLTNMLRGIRHHLERRRCLLPADVLAEHGVSQETLFRAVRGETEIPSDVTAAVFEVAVAALGHLRHAKDLAADGKVDPVAARVLLPYIDAHDYLMRLESAKFNAFDAALTRPSWKFYFRLALASWRGKFHE